VSCVLPTIQGLLIGFCITVYFASDLELVFVASLCVVFVLRIRMWACCLDVLWIVLGVDVLIDCCMTLCPNRLYRCMCRCLYRLS